MEFRAKRGDLLKTLHWTQSIVERRNTMPILANVLIECEKSNIRITATDLEVGVRGELEGEIAKDGTITVNAKKLYEIIREVPTEEVRLKRLENDWVEIKSGKSVFKIVGMDGREFPQFPEFQAEQLLTVPSGALREMIERTLFAVSTDETRYSLNGVFIEESGSGKVRMVSTDGHRLAFEERALGTLGLAKGVILPRKGLGELKKLMESGDDEVVSIGFRENMGLVTKGKVNLFMRLIDGDFPDYTKVIPTGNTTTALIDHTQLLQALRRVSILSNERYRGVKIDFVKDRVAISTNNPDLGEAVEEIEADYDGKPISVGFNARYMIEALTVLQTDGEIRIELKDELSPSVIRKSGQDSYLYVLMPMRL